MSNNDEIETAFIVLIFVIIIILIISILYQKNSNNTEYEHFLNYQDSRKKTLNWCNKMKKVGLLSNDQFNKCVSTYTDAASGILPNEVNSSTNTTIELDYSLYNYRKNPLSPNILEENTNNIMLINSDGSYMGCSNDNSVYFNKNNTVNKQEFIFTLTPLNNNVHTLKSSYGKYLINNDSSDTPENTNIPIIIAGGGAGGGSSSAGGSAGSNANGDGGSGTGNTSIVGGVGGPFKTSSGNNSKKGFALAGGNYINTGGGGGGSNGGMMGNGNGSGGGAGGSYVNPDYIFNNTAVSYSIDNTAQPSVIIDWSSQPTPAINKTSGDNNTKAQPTSATFTGFQQTWTVPSFIYPQLIPITQATFTVIGGTGSSSRGGGKAGYGARIVTTINVSPGNTYNIFVGSNANGLNGGTSQSGYDGGDGAGNGGGGGAATTVILNLVATPTSKSSRKVFCASFTGSTIGPMASWNINKYDSEVDNIIKLSFESVQLPNFFLSSTVNNIDNSLVTNYGNDDTNVWKVIPVTNNIDVPESTIRAKYIIDKDANINKLINIKAKKLCLKAYSDTLYMLKNTINTNYINIINYVNNLINIINEYEPGNNNEDQRNEEERQNEEYLQNEEAQSTFNLFGTNIPIPIVTQAALDPSTFNLFGRTIRIPTTTKAPTTTIPSNKINMTINDKNTLITNITNVQTAIIYEIDEDINSINSLLENATANENNIESEYEEYLQSLSSDLIVVNNKIKDNMNTLNNNQSDFNKVNTDFSYYDKKQQKIKELDKTSNLNIDLITNYSNNNSTLVTYYPVIIFIILLILLYLIYVTFNTFMKNIYYAY